MPSSLQLAIAIPEISDSIYWLQPLSFIAKRRKSTRIPLQKLRAWFFIQLISQMTLLFPSVYLLINFILGFTSMKGLDIAAVSGCFTVFGFFHALKWTIFWLREDTARSLSERIKYCKALRKGSAIPAGCPQKVRIRKKDFSTHFNTI